jgi:peptidoglycan/xylan/chitin deacetylase (PgdA/CDA1 family)
MAKSKSSEENPSNQKSNKIVLLIGSALLVLVLLAAAGAVIANSGSDSENTPEAIKAASQTLPTIQPTATSSNGETLTTEAILPSPVKTTLPTLLPSLTPIPTSTPTEQSSIPTPSPVVIMTQPSSLGVAEAAETKPPPLPTPKGIYSWTLKVPILMYHYISIPPEDANKYRVDLSIAPDAFREQMAYLADNGFETVDLYDLSLAITGKRDLPEKPVIITMDDGYRDNYENAFPILQEFGLSATFFVVTQPIDDGNEIYLTWEMAKEMANAGMRIEPHSKTHADLSSRDREYIVYEILGSQESIAAHTGQTPRFFCYPGGRYDETTIEVVSDLDFWGAVTTEGGEWHGYDDRYEWSRIRMRSTTTLDEFTNLVDPRETVSGKTVES